MKSNFFLSLLTGLFLICAPPLANAQEQGIIDIEPNEIRDKVQGEDYENIYRISNLTITFIQTSTYGTTIYAQNDNGGIQIKDDHGVLYERTYQVGDVLEAVSGLLAVPGMGIPYMTPYYDPGEPTQTGQNPNPVTVTIDELKANPHDYESRLIKIEDVEFFERTEGQTFTSSSANYAIRQSAEGSSINARNLDASLDGTPVPATATLVGISTTPSGTIIGLRSPSDITNIGEPEPEPEPSQPNLFSNGGFEEWGNPSIFNPSGSITDWTSQMGYEKETTNILEGEAALKINSGAMANYLTQDIGSALNPIFKAGDTCLILINYYLVESQGEDISMASTWKGSAGIGELDHDADILNNGIFFGGETGKWQQKTFKTTVPEGAVSFTFNLDLNKESTIIFDDFRFTTITPTETEPEPGPAATITASPALLSFEAEINGCDSSEVVTIGGSHIASDIKVEIAGKDAEFFRSPLSAIPAEDLSRSFKLYYSPLEEGPHSAVLVLSNPDADTVEVELRGTTPPPPGEAAITVDGFNLEQFQAPIGGKHEKTVTVSSQNLTEYITVSREGSGMEHFLISSTLLLRNTDAELTITYQPKAAGTHEAQIVFTSGETVTRVTVKGVCGEAAEEWKETFESMPVHDEYGDFYAEGDQGSYHLVNAIATEETDMENRLVRLNGNGAYLAMDFDILDGIKDVTAHISSSPDAEQAAKVLLQSSTDFGLSWQKVQDTMSAPTDGSSRIATWTANISEPVRLRWIVVNPSETKTALDLDNITIHPSERDSLGIDQLLNLDDSNPLASLEESFDGTRHNKPVVLEGWRNILLKGQRPWWTYQHKNTETEEVENYSAKATAYLSTAATTEDYEMWLVTPALDGTVASKIFTFRVMGDLLPEKDSMNSIECYYIERDGEGYFKSLIEVDMPKIADENGEWREFHVNLSQSDINDVFFMAFRFAAPGGRENSAVYYIDDVTYGKTDLASISASVPQIAIEASAYKVATSDPIQIEGHNLSQPIAVSVSGTHANNFDPSVKTLDAQGGALQVNFLAMEPGTYTAELRLSSQGAADLVIPMQATVSDAVPTIIVAAEDLNIALHVAKGQDSVTSDPIIVNPLVLTEDIRISVEGADAGLFNLSRNSIPMNGVNETFTVTFIPEGKSSAAAQIRLSSAGAEDVLIHLAGTAEIDNANDPLREAGIRVWKQGESHFVEAPGLQQVRILDISGRQVQQHTDTQDHVEFSLQGEARGIYILHIQTPQGWFGIKILN